MDKSILKKFHALLAVLFVTGMLQIFASCSSDGNSEEGGGSLSSGENAQGEFPSSSSGSGSSSSDGGGLSSSNSESEAKITKSKITGVSQKGPFVEGSIVTLYELNNEFGQTGRSFKSIISDNKGSFEIKGVELISPYAMLESSGYYRNEVTGKVSRSPITLFAIADVREKDNFNVNLLTHLEYYRVLNLAESGKSVAEAKKQAQKEILAVFGISGDNFRNSEDMSIFGTTESDAALLAISVLLQSDLGEGEFSQRLTNFAQSVKESGKWENETAKATIVDWASTAGLSGIKSNITGWGLSSEVPDFGKYIYDYWVRAYGFGSCGSENYREIKKSEANGREFVCKSGIWQQPPSYKDKYCFEKGCEYFVDSRDNQSYAYVVIGEQTWMAENLNYEAEGSLCYNNSSTCDGRLYNSQTALTACPKGWHLPTKDEWEEVIGGAESALKATSGWSSSYPGNGSDQYGFSALPDGNGGNRGSWWSADGSNNDRTVRKTMYYYSVLADNGSFSVRCLQD